MSIKALLLAKLFSLHSRVKGNLQGKRALLKSTKQPLLQSWRLILLMAKMSPSSTAAIILCRFYKRLIPSFDLRIKGEFIDMVSLSNPDPGY
jgi:hypothetical protein